MTEKTLFERYHENLSYSREHCKRMQDAYHLYKRMQEAVDEAEKSRLITWTWPRLHDSEQGKL